MSSYGDLLVAAVALCGSLLALAAGLGPWRSPYRLRSISGIVERFGMGAARGVWIFVAVISLVAGVSIASGIRPGYAKPTAGQVGKTHR